MSKIALQDERGFNQIFAPVGSTLLRMRRRNDWFVDQIDRLGARRVLELGSGTGETAAYLASHSDAEIVAVDISKAFVAEANARQRHTSPSGCSPADGAARVACANKSRRWACLHRAKLPQPLLCLHIRHPGWSPLGAAGT